MKIVYVKIPLSKDDSKNINRALELRYLVSDTIEERGLGQIINEGTGEDYIDISFLTNQEDELENNLKSLLLSIGFSKESEILIK